ncbi:BlaI/MecI/CopY family transcriptional regulator [Streptomyces sp. SID1121]|uniref:BlaI/MecI/CopY family transcriptional regulator n=1 Tax=Streptomyces sp. SID1121 TaxID=3425888 RepID=UPI0040559F4E
MTSVRAQNCIVFGPLEGEIMDVLWGAPEPLTVRDVLGRLNRARETPLAYTTVMTVMNRLSDKGAADRVKAGRCYSYSASVSDEAAMAVREVIRDFGVDAVAHFVTEAQNSPDLLARLKRLMVEGPGA